MASGDSGSVYQLRGCPPPSEGWADCVGLPGSISSFLLLKTCNFESDISLDDVRRHVNQQLEPTSFFFF